jgi:hypothetical protein
VFAAIREARPTRLFVAADGPRNPEEKLRTDAARAITEQIDWPCIVQRNYSPKNMGCGKRPATAISWAFEYTDDLIILEDDCLPAQSFFRFCSALLEYYRGDNRIGTINGTTIPGSCQGGSVSSYYFSHFSVIWGWATWKRVWDKFDYEILDWPELKQTNWLDNVFGGNKYFAKGFEVLFDNVKNNWDVWDMQLFYCCFKNNFLNIHPTKNLVSNKGFDGSGTHTMNETPYAALPLDDIGTIKHPSTLVYDCFADNVIFNSLYKYDPTQSLWYKQVLRRIRFRLKLIRKFFKQ